MEASKCKKTMDNGLLPSNHPSCTTIIQPGFDVFLKPCSCTHLLTGLNKFSDSLVPFPLLSVVTVVDIFHDPYNFDLVVNYILEI